MRGSEFAELSVFIAVAQERSFRKAASRLGVTPSATSHSIRALEERVGARLLHRTTRSVAPTDAGLELLGRLIPAVAEIEEAIKNAGEASSHPRGRLRINCPRLAAQAFIIPRMGKFLGKYPDIVFDLVIDDTMEDIVAAGFDAGIRSGEHIHDDMIAVRLTPELRVAVVASTDYVETHGMPASPYELRNHRCINFRWSSDGALYRWRFQQGVKAMEVRIDAPLTVNDTNAIIDCALGGVGYAYMLEDVVAEHIASGRLIRVLDDWCPPRPSFYLYRPRNRHISAPLRAFIDFYRAGSAASSREAPPAQPV